MKDNLKVGKNVSVKYDEPDLRCSSTSRNADFDKPRHHSPTSFDDDGGGAVRAQF